jgi:hypothetical protein
LYAQYITDPSAGLCMDPNDRQFCATQTILPYTLTFTDIPDSFNFGQIQTGATNHICNNGPNATNSLYQCSSSQSPIANTDDLLKIYDNRNSGGFVVTLSTGINSFTDGQNSIPLSNLYMLTTLPQIPEQGINEDGITYNATGSRNIYAPAYVNEFEPDSLDISNSETYTSRTSVTQFGSNPLVLMDGSLDADLGREGYFSQYVNFYLKVDATQAPGNYALILTYDLTDSTI